MNEAEAMTEPTADLAAIVAELQRDLNEHVNNERPPSPGRMEIWRNQVEVIRAALERQAELEGALRELYETGLSFDELAYVEALDRAKAQLPDLRDKRSGYEIGHRTGES